MFSSGKPTINGIRTVVIAGRFLGGESIQSVATDYGLDVESVESAVRYEVLESTKKFEQELKAAERQAKGEQQ